MRVATKLTGAFGVFIIIVAGLLVYHIHTLRLAVDTNYLLSSLSSRVYISSTRLLLQIGALEENASKFHVTRDQGYLDKFTEAGARFEESIDELDADELGDAERAELALIQALWSSFRATAVSLAAAAEEWPDAEAEALLDSMHDQLEAIRGQARRLGESSRDAIVDRLDRTSMAARQAERVAWIVLAGALLLGSIISGLIIRSIAEALSRLQAGTREVAAGNFDYRIDPRNNDEFAQLSRDFNDMIRRLGELDRMKKDFISKVSHDLKTPLASMLETTRALLEEISGPLTERQERLLRLNHQSGERLSAMIAKMLELSALEAGTLGFEPHPLDLIDLITRAREEVVLAGEADNVEIEIMSTSKPIVVVCDAVQMSRLLVNLLENAVKFSPGGGVVEVRIGAHQTRPEEVPEAWWERVAARNRGGAVSISISDMGPGIPEEEWEIIFDRFFQSDSGKRIHRRGVGLGLTICREIVASHRGVIWVDSAPGGGSIFNILLPWGGGPGAERPPSVDRLSPSYQESGR